MAAAEEQPRRRSGSGRIVRFTGALLAGFVGGLIAPMLYPSLSRRARPAAKAALKAGMAALEQGRIAAAELAEHASDLVAEASSEFESGRPPAAAAGQAETEEGIVSLRMSGRGAAGD